MFDLVKNYCKYLQPYSCNLFILVGISIMALLIGILLINPYKKSTTQLAVARKTILRKSKRNNAIYLKKPRCYRDGWDIFCQTRELSPAQCLVFNEKRPCYLFDALVLLEISTLTPVCLVAGVNKSFGWQFFIPILFVALFLAIFQTHRLLYRQRTEKAQKAHLAFIDALESTIKKGFYPTTERNAKSKRLELHKTPQINIGFLTAPQREEVEVRATKEVAKREGEEFSQFSHNDSVSTLQYLLKNDVEEETAREIVRGLKETPQDATPVQRKKLNKLLEKAFEEICKPTLVDQQG